MGTWFGLPLSAKADPVWIEFKVGTHTVKALMALPSGPGPHAAVIYNHGTAVRKNGYTRAKKRGYDVAGYVKALADAGYVAFAPIRSHLSSAKYKTAIVGGVETVQAAIGYLKSRPDVDSTRIGAVGFSEGGLVTLWSAIDGVELKAIVLMSPATIKGAGDKQLKAAVQKSIVKRITIPIFLTVGINDNRSILKVMQKKLIPNLQKNGPPFTYKTDYPGDHKWFWKVRSNHFKDLKAFFIKYLSGSNT